jgi:hypothetical protein
MVSPQNLRATQPATGMMIECCRLPCKQNVHAGLLLLLLLLLLQGAATATASVLQFPLLSVLCNVAEQAWWPDKGNRSAVPQNALVLSRLSAKGAESLCCWGKVAARTILHVLICQLRDLLLLIC